jgi:hypothetical protein
MLAGLRKFNDKDNAILSFSSNGDNPGMDGFILNPH